MSINLIICVYSVHDSYYITVMFTMLSKHYISSWHSKLARNCFCFFPASVENRHMLWEYVKRNWPSLNKAYNTASFVLGKIVGVSPEGWHSLPQTPLCFPQT